MPSTPHQPAFTPEQLEQARRVAHGQQYPHVQVLRARLTLVAAEPTISHAEAGRRCGLAPHTVYQWRRRWATHGWSLTDAPRPGRKPGFPPPEQVVTIKALACERPAARNRPLSRLSVFDVCRTAWEQGLTMSLSTVWRLLHRDALCPWLQRQWLFPRDPQLLEKATPILERYLRRRALRGG